MSENAKVGILVEDLYEELELWYPHYRLIEAGHQPILIGPEKGTFHGKRGHYPARVDARAGDLAPRDIDALVIPGGYAPDRMRRSETMIALARDVAAANKPVAAICHAAWMLISAGLVEGHELTSFASVRDDVVNAGGKWVDAPVVVDGKLITSRTPDDLPVFTTALLDMLAEAP
jgi:protease I